MTDSELDLLIAHACRKRSHADTPPDFSRALAFSPHPSHRFPLLRLAAAAVGAAVVLAGVIMLRIDSPASADNLYVEMQEKVGSRLDNNRLTAEKIRDNIDKEIPIPCNVD